MPIARFFRNDAPIIYTMQKKRILGFCDYGTSGLAVNLRLPLAHWHAQGHDVWFLGWSYDGNVHNVNRGPSMYPYADHIIPCGGGIPRGCRELPEVIKMLQPDILITGYDLWFIPSLLDPEHEPYYAGKQEVIDLLHHERRRFVHIAVFPLENLYVGGYINRTAETLIGNVDLPVCYAEFSRRAILRSTGLDVPIIPLAIDTSIFYPRGREQSRKQLGLPEDAFLIAMVASNQWRKLWNEFLDVMSRIVKRHPDVRIIPWTEEQRVVGGIDLHEYLYRSDLVSHAIMPGSKVGTLTDDGMAQLYSAIDLLVLTTAAEGAGLSPMQARACGTPALTSANTATIEFSGDPYELIPSQPNGVIHGIFGPPNTVVYSTDVNALEDRIEKLYRDRELRLAVATRSQKTMEAFNPEKILPLWDALLTSIER
jgi:glycosyltransferase involved in cell wall biosynthesis